VSEIPVLVNEPKEGGAAPTFILAHGAGAGMDHRWMEDIAVALAEESIRVVRFEFPYMEQYRITRTRGRPDPAAVLEETWLRVIEQVDKPGEVFIGGKSMGGRIASMVADRAGVKGLICLGYPFHPAGRPTTLRVAHLAELMTPTLILQGERDALGSATEIAGYKLSRSIRVLYLPDGDHSFKPRKSSGHTAGENMAAAVHEVAAFCLRLTQPAPGDAV
jgi:hypothetical protein